MGTYLSTPVVEKSTEEGEDLDCSTPVVWGVVDMQGWRKSMEDSHIAQTDIPPPPSALTKADAQLFAVFDGHGGAEVARFCQLYLIDVLTNQGSWTGDNVDVGTALVKSFHALDDLVDNPDRREEINSLRSDKPNASERRTVEGSKLTTSDEEGPDHGDEKKSEEKSNDNDDSNVVVGEIADDRLDEDGNDNDNDDSTDDAPEETVSIFKKLLSIHKERHDENPNGAENSTPVKSEVDVIPPTKILNGRQVCNLPDHPIHAGCTAVCAVIVGGTLTVANAGDSRVVLCRQHGITEAMSFDHKPMSEIEMKRITEAGGFVNQFGRVNGNLNLSRSIGDLKYKKVPNIAPADQMITAQPDIKSVTLNEKDEFIILACDGIWDCLTNEEAVKYVLDRIDTTSPTEIGIEMLDEIISVNPRETQGIGGDNMTVMIVDLQPTKRSYRKN